MPEDDAWYSAGKPGEAVHASFAGYVSREMGKAEALLKVVGSRPENLVDNFFTLMPSGSPADFQRILELKAWPQCHRDSFPKEQMSDLVTFMHHSSPV